MDFAQKKPGGLSNLSNTCYLNAAIACLGHCEPFLKYVLSIEASSLKKNSLMAELRELLYQLWINEHSLIPRKFLKCIHDNLGNDIDIFSQNDLSEFVGILIDKLNDDVCEEIGTKLDRTTYADTPYDIQRYKMDIDWTKTNKKTYSPLKELFYGQMISQIICGHCHKIFHNYEMFNTTMLTIENNEKNLNDCFDTFFKEEVKEDWRCDACQQIAPSKKTLKLWRLPEILLITLKRFDYNNNKNNKQISMPLNLDVGNFTLSRGATKFNLKSVGYHMGNTENGHYIAIVHHPNGSWYFIDDLSRNKLDTPNVSNGYVFFYCKS